MSNGKEGALSWRYIILMFSSLAAIAAFGNQMVTCARNFKGDDARTEDTYIPRVTPMPYETSYETPFDYVSESFPEGSAPLENTGVEVVQSYFRLPVQFLGMMGDVSRQYSRDLAASASQGPPASPSTDVGGNKGLEQKL